MREEQDEKRRLQEEGFKKREGFIAEANNMMEGKKVRYCNHCLKITLSVIKLIETVWYYLTNQSGYLFLQLKIQELEKEKTELQDKLKELEGMCVVRVLTNPCRFFFIECFWPF